MKEFIKVIIGLVSNENLMAAILGAMIGGIATYLSEYHFRKRDGLEQEKHYASMLYYDLESIKDYVLNDRSSVDIRYYEGWQNIVANCTFLKSEHISHIYKIYDAIYNFDYSIRSLKQKGMSARKSDIEDFKKLLIYLDDKNAICAEMFNELMKKMDLHK